MRTALLNTLSAAEQLTQGFFPLSLKLFKRKDFEAFALLIILSLTGGSTIIDFDRELASRVYDFKEVPVTLTRFDLERLSVLPKDETLDLLTDNVPETMQENFRRYVKKSLFFAQKYQVDPLWVLAIMWTESHYRTESVSSVGARGLMQIMPQTSKYLAYKLKKANYGPFVPNQYFEFTRPEINIEMGVYYLNYLLEKFNHNPELATIAYNVGPGRLKQIIKKGNYSAHRNLYLKKVKRAYIRLASSFNANL